MPRAPEDEAALARVMARDKQAKLPRPRAPRKPRPRPPRREIVSRYTPEQEAFVAENCVVGANGRCKMSYSAMAAHIGTTVGGIASLVGRIRAKQEKSQ